MTAPLGWGLDPWGTGPWGSVIPSSPLSVQSALAISTNEVRVILSRTPQIVASTVEGDALNPDTWLIQRLDTFEFFNILGIEQIDDVTFVITVLQPFGSVRTTHRVSSTTLLDPVGDPISSPNFANFAGILSLVNSSATNRADAATSATRDVSNPALPGALQNTIGGTLEVTTDGDYAIQSGAELIKKLILRRLVSRPGDFFHLPDYGVGINEKGLLPASELSRLRVEIERQVVREPEVQTVAVTLTLSSDNVLTVMLKAKLRNTGASLDMTIPVPKAQVVL